jgi:hypothetical protein
VSVSVPAQDDALRTQLLGELSPRARRVGEAFLDEWERAVAAVPELSGAAAAEYLELLRMPTADREAALRRRGERRGVDTGEVSLLGRVSRSLVPARR